MGEISEMTPGILLFFFDLSLVWNPNLPSSNIWTLDGSKNNSWGSENLGLNVWVPVSGVNSNWTLDGKILGNWS